MKMKFNEIVKQFQNNVFGKLTTIKTQKNIVWFVGEEIKELLGHTNITQAIKDAKLNSDEVFILTKNVDASFWNEFATKYCLAAKVRSVTFISESGLYKLMLRSNMPAADKFVNWITREVLPTLRKSVENDMIMKATINIGDHLSHEFQKQQSKNINKVNLDINGVEEIIEYNRNNSVDHTGLLPHEWKEFGKKVGLPSKERTSGKEVIRKYDKPAACAMSLNDYLVANGVPYQKAIEISNSTGKELFKQLLDAGITPKELNM